MFLAFYRLLTAGSAPILEAYLTHRRRKGKEHPTRHRERFGEASIPRPAGKLLWIHGASNGEFLSVVPLIPLLLAQKPDWSVLVTAGTLSACASFEKQAAQFPPGRVVHQFVPVDHPAWVQKFMDHWQPDGVLWLESELWPNLLRAIKQLNLPAVLLNARMRPKTAAFWRRLPDVIREMLSTFDSVLVMAKSFMPVFQELGAKQVVSLGNLKIDKPPLPIDTDKLAALRDMIGTRRCIGAFQTHPTDEKIFAETLKKLRATYRDLLGIVALKHPARGANVVAELITLGMNVVLRSTGESITAATDLYIADTLGEMGLWFSLCPFGLIGGSLFPFGGQNPYEGLHFGCVPVYGPHMFNFPDTTEILQANDIAVTVRDGAALYQAFDTLLRDPALLTAKQETARRVVTEAGPILQPTADYIVQHVMSA